MNLTIIHYIPTITGISNPSRLAVYLFSTRLMRLQNTDLIPSGGSGGKTVSTLKKEILESKLSETRFESKKCFITDCYFRIYYVQYKRN